MCSCAARSIDSPPPLENALATWGGTGFALRDSGYSIWAIGGGGGEWGGSCWNGWGWSDCGWDGWGGGIPRWDCDVCRAMCDARFIGCVTVAFSIWTANQLAGWVLDYYFNPMDLSMENLKASCEATRQDCYNETCKAACYGDPRYPPPRV